MSVISEIKCARCDRLYSGVRSRCPYCGARRVGAGKYSEGANDSKGQTLIGNLIMAVLVAAAAGLLLTSHPGDDPTAGLAAPPTGTGHMPDEGDNQSLSGLNVGPTEPPASPDITPEDPTPAPPEVESVLITYNNRAIAAKEFTMRLPNERTLQLGVKVEPAGIEEEIVWTSSNTSVLEVVKRDTTGTSVLVTALKDGTVTLTVTVGGVSDEVTARVRR
jgi:DNA-directed RNA polymerase subunit RPC12/RpoP